MSSCLGTRYLKDGEKLLYRQSIKAPIGFYEPGLPDLYVQKANRKVLNLPINTLAWMHHAGLKRFNDSTSKSSKQAFLRRKAAIEEKFNRKIASTNDQKKKSNLAFRKQKKIDGLNTKIENGNLLMQWGEPVAVFDTAAMHLTAERIEDHLFNHGYFLSNVSTRTNEFKRRVGVVYQLEPGPVYTYDTLLYQIPDSTVLSYVKKSEGSSLIKKGEHYSQEKISQERERVDLMLKDVGYYDFSRQYIDFDVDTAFRSPHKVAVRVKISNPARRDFHKQFIIDSVSITPDAGIQTGVPLKRQTKVYKNMTFTYLNDYYSERILRQRIFLYKDSLYSRSKTFDTQRQLANLDVFKFVNVNYDTSGGRFVASIFSSPQDRYSWSNEAGVSLTQGFPGPYYSLSFKKRNIFRGLETFELTGRFGFEGVASATEDNNILRSTEANGNATLTFPQFIIPFTGELSNKLGKYNPRTRLLAGYSYTDRPEYNRSIATLSNTFTWDNRRTSQYAFTITSLNIIQSTKNQAFQELLEKLQQQGNNLINSFRPSFVSSMIFSITWNPNNYGNTDKNSFFLRSTLESGGTIFNIKAFPSHLISEQGLQLYKYLRGSLDFRRNQVINKNTNVAIRINTGVGYAYGDEGTQILPYEKFFFAGGSNSVRAWRPRRLGQGSYPPGLAADSIKDGRFDYRFEKPGSILLEGSIELRKKLFGFVNGAVFVDAGNVWSFETTKAADPSPTTATWTGDTKFNPKDFYKAIGVGTGFGLRFDFTFLILRLDVGVKVYDPARDVKDRFVLDDMKFFRPFYFADKNIFKEPVIYNIGIGYPF